MKLTPAILVLAASLAALPAARAGSLEDDATGWRKPRYDRPVYVPRRGWEPAPDRYRGASLVPPMINTWNPPRHDFHGHAFAPRPSPGTVIVIDRHPGWPPGGRPNLIGGPRR